MIAGRYNFDLTSLRLGCREYFHRWDEAVEASNRQAASEARRQLLAFTRKGLAVPTANYAGVYIFYRHSEQIGIGDISYIGISKGSSRPMRVRLEDRLRDDNCFDYNLDNLPRADAAAIIRKRIATAMPRSKKDYVEKHLGVCDLVKRSGMVQLNAVTEVATIIEGAEKALIASAWALGAPLANKKSIKFRRSLPPEAVHLARQIACEPNSLLDVPDAERWRAEIERRWP